MSSSLVKQSLALFDDDLVKEPAKKKKAKDPMSLISTKKKGVRKELRKLQTQKQKKTSQRSGHLSYNDYQVPEVYDYTDKSIEILSRLSQLDSSSKKTTETISDHHQKKKKRKPAPSKETKIAEEKSAFSDKDFEAFAKDFDFGKLKKK